MSSKRFRGKPCAYCALNPATTGDHVFAREFFLPTERDDLPQVPACEVCNNLKSQLEHYLTAILPFGGRHADARANFDSQVSRRLQRNQKLFRELATGRGDAWTFEENAWQQGMTLPFDPKLAAQFFAMVGRGLALHHFSVYLQDGQISGTIFPTAELLAIYDDLFKHPDHLVISHTLGNDTVTYTGLLALIPQVVTMWRIRFYGGLVLADSAAPETANSSEIIVVTGPQEFVNKFTQM